MDIFAGERDTSRSVISSASGEENSFRDETQRKTERRSFHRHPRARSTCLPRWNNAPRFRRRQPPELWNPQDPLPSPQPSCSLRISPSHRSSTRALRASRFSSRTRQSLASCVFTLPTSVGATRVRHFVDDRCNRYNSFVSFSLLSARSVADIFPGPEQASCKLLKLVGRSYQMTREMLIPRDREFRERRERPVAVRNES